MSFLIHYVSLNQWFFPPVNIDFKTYNLQHVMSHFTKDKAMEYFIFVCYVEVKEYSKLVVCTHVNTMIHK